MVLAKCFILFENQTQFIYNESQSFVYLHSNLNCNYALCLPLLFVIRNWFTAKKKKGILSSIVNGAQTYWSKIQIQICLLVKKKKIYSIILLLDFNWNLFSCCSNFILEGKVLVYKLQQCIIHHIMNKMNNYQCMNQTQCWHFLTQFPCIIISRHASRDKSYGTVISLNLSYIHGSHELHCFQTYW